MVIDIENLQFRWREDGPAVLAIEALQVAAGEGLFIKGPSGSGKSTLLSLLSGVATADAGSVRVMEQPLETLGSVQRDHRDQYVDHWPHRDGDTCGDVRRHCYVRRDH